MKVLADVSMICRQITFRAFFNPEHTDPYTRSQHLRVHGMSILISFRSPCCGFIVQRVRVIRARTCCQSSAEEVSMKLSSLTG